MKVSSRRTPGPIIPVVHCVALSRNKALALLLTINGTAYGSRRSQGRREDGCRRRSIHLAVLADPIGIAQVAS